MLMYAIMVAAGIGMVIGLQKEKGGAAWGRPMAIVCIIIAVGAAVYQMALGGSGGRNKQRDIETQYRGVKGEKLGTYLASEFSGKKALILLPAEMLAMGGEGGSSEPTYKAVLEGLEKGMAGKLSIVGKIEPKMPPDVKAKLQQAMGSGAEDMAMMPEGQMWFDVPALEKELTPYKDKYDLLICLTSLPGVDTMMMGGGKKPVPLAKLSIMQKGSPVKLVLAEGGVNKFGAAIATQKVVAAVTYKQDISEEAYENQPPKELDAAFDMRYVLITPKNVREHKAFFGR